MSVDFKISGTRIDLDGPTSYLNLANLNAAELLGKLGLPVDLYGEAPAADLARRCHVLLAILGPEITPGRDGLALGRLTICDCRPGYLEEKARDLLALCERADADRVIVWA